MKDPLFSILFRFGQICNAASTVCEGEIYLHVVPVKNFERLRDRGLSEVPVLAMIELSQLP